MVDPKLIDHLSKYTPTKIETDYYADKQVAPISSLDDLIGPSDSVTLPITIDWTPMKGKPYNLTNKAHRDMCYRLVLSEGTPDEIAPLVNKNRLIEAWPTLAPTLPIAVKNSWEQKFPSLKSS